MSRFFRDLTTQSGRRPASGDRAPVRSLFRQAGLIPKIAAAVVGGIVLLVVLTTALSGYDKTSGGEIGVVRNGGPLDNNRIRLVIQPGSGLTCVGLYSSMHRYPAQQRLYTITSDPERGARMDADVVRTPSSDGVDMGIEGTIYFNLNLDPQAMKAFDDKFGTRGFRAGENRLLHAWDGYDGWSAFIDAVMRPVSLTLPTGEVLDEHIVARVPDDDPDWNQRFLLAREEAAERAFHLNADSS